MHAISAQVLADSLHMTFGQKPHKMLPDAGQPSIKQPYQGTAYDHYLRPPILEANVSCVSTSWRLPSGCSRLPVTATPMLIRKDNAIHDFEQPIFHPR